MTNTNTTKFTTIPTYPNYAISEQGEVRNVKTEKNLSVKTSKTGNQTVQLSVNGKTKTVNIIELRGAVAVAKKEAAAAEKLKAEKAAEAKAKKEKKASKAPKTKAKKEVKAEKKVVPLKRNRVSVVGTHITTGKQIFFATAREAMKSGFNPSCISRNIHGKQKDHAGYVWSQYDASETYNFQNEDMEKPNSKQAERYYEKFAK